MRNLFIQIECLVGRALFKHANTLNKVIRYKALRYLGLYICPTCGEKYRTEPNQDISLLDCWLGDLGPRCPSCEDYGHEWQDCPNCSICGMADHKADTCRHEENCEWGEYHLYCPQDTEVIPAENYYLYPVELTQSHEDNCWYARIPALDGCMSDGTTPNDAIRRIRDAQELWLTSSIEDRHEAPTSLVR